MSAIAGKKKKLVWPMSAIAEKKNLVWPMSATLQTAGVREI